MGFVTDEPHRGRTTADSEGKPSLCALVQSVGLAPFR